MAIIKIRNTAIDLDAAEIPNLDAAKITSGTFADARIAASNVSQHATSFDDNKIVNDISTLGLRVHTQENLNASNTNSASFDVFQDSSGITNLTNVLRNSNEYVNTSSESTLVSNGTLIETGKSSEAVESNTTDNGYFGQAILIKPNTKIIFRSVFFYGTGTGGGSTKKIYISENSSGSLTTPSGATNYYTYTYSNSSDLVGGTMNNPTTIDNLNGGSNLQAWLVVETTGFSGGMIAGKRTGNSTTDAYYNTLGTNYLGASIARINVSGITQAMSADEIMAMKIVGDAIQLTTNATGSFEGNAITASSTNKMGAVITYQDNAGTNALNTDIILKLSADNGSNYSTATLTALPDFATGIKMAKVNDLSVTAGTQLKYKIEFANQSGSKNARIRGVSLQY